MSTTEQLQEEVLQLMEDYKNRPSNANKAYQSMQALIQRENRAFLIEKLNEISTVELRKNWSMGPLSGKEVCDAVENQKKRIIAALQEGQK